MSWLGFAWAGLHPALALLPIVPFLLRTPRDVLGEAVDTPRSHRDQSHFEYLFEHPVQAIALLFGLVNGGVLIRGFGSGTWAVLAATLVGRPFGVLCGVGAATAFGLPFPRQIGWRELIVVALIVAPCMTFGLFVAASAFPDGPLLIETRMGALTTVIAVVPAFVAARLLHVDRLASRRADNGIVRAGASRL